MGAKARVQLPPRACSALLPSLHAVLRKPKVIGRQYHGQHTLRPCLQKYSAWFYSTLAALLLHWCAHSVCMPHACTHYGCTQNTNQVCTGKQKIFQWLLRGKCKGFFFPKHTHNTHTHINSRDYKPRNQSSEADSLTTIRGGRAAACFLYSHLISWPCPHCMQDCLRWQPGRCGAHALNIRGNLPTCALGWE